MGEKVNPTKAAQIATDNGTPTEKATLDTKRSTGGGPPFYKKDDEKNAWYDVDEVIEWAKSSEMKRYTSTSEYSTRKKKTPKPNGAPPEDKPSDPSSGDAEGE